MSTSRTICIGDVHGNPQSLATLLEFVHLDRERDTVIFLGDLVDRGRDSKGVLDLIIQLQLEGYRTIALRGNHEQLLLDAAFSGIHEDYLEFLENAGKITLLSFEVDHPSQILQVYLDFLRSMPHFWQNKTHICVHAGLPCELTKPISAADRWEMLWTRSTWTNPMFLNGKRLVTGHSIKSMKDIRESLNTDHVFVDNGCFLGAGYKRGTKGNLVAVCLESNELFIQPNIDGLDQ